MSSTESPRVPPLALQTAEEIQRGAVDPALGTNSRSISPSPSSPNRPRAPAISPRAKVSPKLQLAEGSSTEDAPLTGMQESPSPTLPGVNAHNLQPITLTAPTFCHFCRQFIFGMVKQGLACSECKYVIHQRCAEQSHPSCPFDPATSSSFSVRLSWNDASPSEIVQRTQGRASDPSPVSVSPASSVSSFSSASRTSSDSSASAPRAATSPSTSSSPSSNPSRGLSPSAPPVLGSSSSTPSTSSSFSKTPPSSSSASESVTATSADSSTTTEKKVPLKDGQRIVLTADDFIVLDNYHPSGNENSPEPDYSPASQTPKTAPLAKKHSESVSKPKKSLLGFRFGRKKTEKEKEDDIEEEPVEPPKVSKSKSTASIGKAAGKDVEVEKLKDELSSSDSSLLVRAPSHTQIRFPGKIIASRGNRVAMTLSNPLQTKEEKELQVKIDFLLGQFRRSIAGDLGEDSDPEIRHFKRSFYKIAQDFKIHSDHAPVDCTYASLYEYDVRKWSVCPLPEVFPATFHFPDKFSKTMRCEGRLTMDKALKELLRFCQKPADDASLYFVKICGRAEFVDPDVPLIQLTYVCECLRKERDVDFVLVPRTYELESKLLSASRRYESHEIFALDGADDDANLPNSISHISIVNPFELTLHRLQSLPTPLLPGVDGSSCSLVVEMALYFGGSLLAPVVTGSPVPMPASVESPIAPVDFKRQRLVCEKVPVWRIPRGARVCLTVYVQTKNKQRSALGWVGINLVTFDGRFMSGTLPLRLWYGEKANPIGTCVDNVKQDAPIVLLLEFSSFSEYHPKPVVFTPLLPPEEISKQPTYIPEPPEAEDFNTLHALCEKDSLYTPTKKEKDLLWEHRFYLRKNSRALSLVLQGLDWSDPASVAESKRALRYWVDLNPVDALELLDARFQCPEVRAFAVMCLHKTCTDSELKDYLLELVQALKYEPYHDSPLSRFLLSRALNNQLEIGHFLFWHLKAELHVPEISVRYSLILETYLRGCSSDAVEHLLRQQEVLRNLTQVAAEVKEKSTKANRKEILHAALKSLELPSSFALSLTPTVFVKGLKIEQCKVMDSAKLPLWLVFENVDDFSKPVAVMFKAGDDLRQDMLTLQMFHIMDRLWKSEGLDLALSPYAVLATGPMQGMLEMVSDSKTVAAIQKEFGVNGVFKETALLDWFVQEKPALDRTRCAENFMLSCAGYCVATYVLGITDRHNDNIMVTKHGHLFHIDFGHFLGNIKTWAGISRERAPFILTPEFAYVMGGKNGSHFQRFVTLCCEAYGIVRTHANIFINLFTMMVSTGIPELRSYEDIEYLRKAFSLEDSPQLATESFTKLIYSSLNTKATQINFFFHNLAH